MRALVKDSGGCFFCTQITTGRAFETRPTALEEIDDEGNFWFLSAVDSRKNVEILRDPFVQVLFQAPSSPLTCGTPGMAP